MRLLLDTHAFLWMALEPSRLSAVARKRLGDASTEKFSSIASIWEMAIKIRLGKLRLEDPLEDVIEIQAVQNGIPLLAIRRNHATTVASLPLHHRDPFDRLLVCQAAAEAA